MAAEIEDHILSLTDARNELEKRWQAEQTGT